MIERNITPEDMEEYMKFEDECIKKGFYIQESVGSEKKADSEKIKILIFL